MRILIVGGYGAFGGRLVELIEDDPRLTLIVSGRSRASAEEYCASRSKAVATLVPAVFDRNGTSQQLRELRPDLVVDASGPFQSYGEKPYNLIEQCLECRVSYMDLADGSDFVAGVPQFDSAAKAAGIFALAGVSSFPVLTAAVVRRLSADMKSLASIRGGIAPSPFAGVGSNVIRAIASYSGQRVAVRRNGRSEEGRPFVETVSYVICVPGRLPLGRRKFSLVDVPDLHVLPELWPTVQDVWMGAAPVPQILHRMLNVFAWLVKIRLLPSLSWMARAMHFVTGHAQWGEHRGGMFLEVKGLGADGKEVVRLWHLLAEGDDGPLIPCMALEAIIRNWLAGKRPPNGARTAIQDVSLEDYESLFQKRTVYSGTREPGQDQGLPLFQRILGTSWQRLAQPIQQLHSVRQARTFCGHCTVRRGRNPLARFVARVTGFPKQGVDRPLTVRLEPHGNGERWTRSCDGRTFSSTQTAGRGGSEWLARETFGPVSVDMALLQEGSNLRYVIRRWALCGIPLPLAWGPRSKALESVHDGLFKFDVEISHALTGLIVHYSGTLRP
ncbi:MAG TPA: DUF4166 domain-containing protein [Steroidobacteraceae bacterium]